jgi:chemotaxis protein methyltransferase CheR
MTAPNPAFRRNPEITQNDFNYLQQLLLERAGILLDHGKEYLAEARLTALADELGHGSIAELLDKAHAEGEFGALQRRVIEAMTVTETSFFRDLHPFQALRTIMLPELIRRRGPDAPIHIWCAAAASGQEIYSVALILNEHFPELARSRRVRLLATDISEAMLSRARAGSYSQIEVNRGLPAPLLVKYFAKRDTEWQIDEKLRTPIEFRQMNLAAPWPHLPPMDIVLMRNVMIYFDVETKRTVLGRVAKVLRPDGYLILGGGETTLHLDDTLKPETLGRVISYRLPQGPGVPTPRAAA